MENMKLQRNCFLGCHRIYDIYKLQRYYAHAHIRKPPARAKDAKASSSFENVTCYFCDHSFKSSRLFGLQVVFQLSWN